MLQHIEIKTNLGTEVRTYDIQYYTPKAPAHSYVTWHIHRWHDTCIRDMTHSYVTWHIQSWHGTFICAPWHIHTWHDTFMGDMTHSYVIWHIHTCAMTHSHVRQDSFLRSLSLLLFPFLSPSPSFRIMGPSLFLPHEERVRVREKERNREQETFLPLFLATQEGVPRSSVLKEGVLWPSVKEENLGTPSSFASKESGSWDPFRCGFWTENRNDGLFLVCFAECHLEPFPSKTDGSQDPLSLLANEEGVPRFSSLTEGPRTPSFILPNFILSEPFSSKTETETETGLYQSHLYVWPCVTFVTKLGRNLFF